MERRIEQDYDEFEMLLGEIPNMTSENQHLEKSVSPDMEGLPLEDKNGLPNFYQASLITSPGKSAAYGGLSFKMPSTICSSSFQGSPEQTLQINGKLVEAASSIENIDRDNCGLLNGQCLSSAFTKLNISEGVAMETMSPSYLKKPVSSLNSGNLVIHSPPSPHTLNGIMSPSLNGVDKFNLEMNGVDSGKYLTLDIQELKKQKPVSGQLFGTFSCDFREQPQTFPVYNGAMSPDTHTFRVRSNVPVPVPGVEYPVTPYQQQYFLDARSPIPFMQAQQLKQPQVSWRHIEDPYHRMHQQYLYVQQLQNQAFGACYPIQENIYAREKPITRIGRQPNFETPISYQSEQGHKDPFWDNATSQKVFNHVEFTPVDSRFCHYCAQGLCGGGEGCPFVDSQKQAPLSSSAHGSPMFSVKDYQAVQVLDNVGEQIFPEKILTRSHGLNSLTAINPGCVGCHESPDHSNGNVFPDSQLQHYQSALNAGSFQLNSQSSCGSSPDFMDLRHNNSRCLPQKYNSVEEVVGRIYLLAKDQHGCRFLQRKFSEGNADDIYKIFVEIIDRIVELMTDPFGNYLVQKLLEVCNEDQRMRILQEITRKPGELVRISRDSHGTRAVQKLVETIKTPEQFSVVVSSLKPGIVKLAKDINGNHVAQRCLQHLTPEYREFLFEAAAVHCVELATDRHGCCVLQKCLSNSDGEQKHQLICKITSNSFDLSRDPFGNYVVQFVLELGFPWATMSVLNKLNGNYGYLSKQKYSSNVVERCLKFAGEECRPRIIQELIKSSQLDEILQDPYGNYVIQAALNHSKGALRAALVEAIKPHVPALRTSPYGKKVLSSINAKK